MKKKKHIRLYIFAATSIITYFLFHAARASAIAERGNSTAIGGECLLLLLPIIAVLFFENIALTKEVRTQRQKSKAKRKSNIGKIRIVGIKNINIE